MRMVSEQLILKSLAEKRGTTQQATTVKSVCEELQGTLRAFHRKIQPRGVKESLSGEETIKLRFTQAEARSKGLRDKAMQSP